MEIKYYQVDAFTSDVFTGNPAGVCLLPKQLPDNLLQKIAKENNLPVTAFIRQNENGYEIRWITTMGELDLCGHGTMAASHVIFNLLDHPHETIEFQSPTAGKVVVKKCEDLIEIDFPVKALTQIEPSEALIKGIGAQVVETWEHHDERVLVVLKDESQIKNLGLNFNVLCEDSHVGITVTAPSNQSDFVSRTFYPYKIISEDAVTGAAHCLLVPYWANRLAKTELHSRQISERGGELFCTLKGNRVLFRSKAVCYMQGVISI